MTGDALSRAHERAFKELWGEIPTKITGGAIITASDEQDMHKATDLIVRATSVHQVAMRVRGYAYLQGDVIDFSVRVEVPYGGITERDKLRAGFCDLYFIGCSDTYANAGAARCAPCRNAQLLHAYLLSLDAMRKERLFEDSELTIHPNGDGTAGGYLSFKKLDKRGCILWTTPNIAALRKTFAVQERLF